MKNPARMLGRLRFALPLAVFGVCIITANANCVGVAHVCPHRPIDGKHAEGDPAGQSLGADDSSPIGCTRILWNDNPVAVCVGRSADWFKAAGSKDPSDPELLVMPRGLLKSGAMYGEKVIVSDNPATWTSRYGSVVVTNQNLVVFDGINEKGLSAHALALSPTDYGARDVSRQGIQMGLLVPYVLDNAATVEEAIGLFKRIQPVGVLLDNFSLGVAVTIEDRQGNSAVVEYPKGNNGTAKIYQGRDVRVFSNLDIDECRKIQQRDFPIDTDSATRNTMIPGNGGRIQRYVRASFFSAFLSKMQPKDPLEVRAALTSVMRSVSNPIGAPGEAPGQGPYSGDETNWVTLTDLTNLVYIFDSARTLNSVSTDLKLVDFRPGTGVRAVNPQNPLLHGDITKLYRRTRRTIPGLAGQVRSVR
jgi:penicillin V acylase-like amidase (Ntn superfamily)